MEKRYCPVLCRTVYVKVSKNERKCSTKEISICQNPKNGICSNFSSGCCII